MIDADKLKEELMMFGYDIARTTLHLFAVLRGLELVREQQHSLYAQLGPAHPGSPRFPLRPSTLDADFLVLGHHPLDELRPGGAIEQFAYQAWVVGLASRWETERRPRSRAALGPDGSPPEMDVMGDLRHIRNDLIHAHGRATKDHCGKCKVLRWFEPGEQMTLRLAHVLDFIHQSGFLGPMTVATSDGDRTFLWGSETADVLRARRPAPKIVSLRTEPIPHHDTNELWAGISVIYDNGFQGQMACPTGRQQGEKAFHELRTLLSQMYISDDGDLIGPEPWLCMSGRRSYLGAIDERERRARGEPLSADFPQSGFHGPPIKLGRSESSDEQT